MHMSDKMTIFNRQKQVCYRCFKKFMSFSRNQDIFFLLFYRNFGILWFLVRLADWMSWLWCAEIQSVVSNICCLARNTAKTCNAPQSESHGTVNGSHRFASWECSHLMSSRTHSLGRCEKNLIQTVSECGVSESDLISLSVFVLNLHLFTCGWVTQDEC